MDSQTASQAAHRLAAAAAAQADEASEAAGVALALARRASAWAILTAEVAEEADRHSPAA